ncbi:6-bladed beta-propeller [Rhodohalobacter halophilus]|uniref:6-bladed beta-propeller n=1 Tax=Rhodohalobacter halophilus TaxID=1812810 RepID=UPI00159F02D7|nr:6-bladed beta-propeller [Rhodohalobacter halophilus]
MRKLLPFLFLLMIACSSDSDSEFNQEQLSEIELSVEFDLSESGDIDFGFIRNIYLDSFENIYVADAQRNSILILDQNGELIREFNNRGQGPGEYLTLAQIFVNNQSLYIVDSNQLKVSEFQIENDLGELTHIEDFIYPDRAFRRVVNFWPYDDENYLFVFGESFSQHDLWDIKYERLELFDKTSQVYTEVYQLPQREYFRFSNSGGFGIRVLPYGTKPIFSKNNGDIFYGHNSELTINKFNFQNPENSTQVLEKVLEPTPVSSQERQSILEDEYYASRNAESEIREQLPEIWPLYETFLIDDNEYIWVAVNLEGFKNGELWWVFNNEGEGLYQAKLKEPIIFHTIKNGKAYGVTESELGVHSLITFNINN